MAAAVALWLIRRGFRYVPVTYTGIAFLNFVPCFLRGFVSHDAFIRCSPCSPPLSSL